MTPQGLESASSQGAALGWFSTLPPEVQAAIIGCVGLLAGACITAWLAFHQYRQQRAIEIKKELILDSVRGSHQANACLSLMPDINRTTEEISRLFTDHLGKIAMAGSVADIATVAKGRDLLNVLGPAFVNLAAARQPLVELTKNLRRVENLMDSQHNDNARYFSMQSEALAAGDDVRFSNIQHMLKSGTEYFNELSEERDSLVPKLDRERRAIFDKVIATQAKTMQAIREYVASVRKDIGVGKDQEAFMLASFIDSTLVKKTVEQAFKEMDARGPSDKP